MSERISGRRVRWVPLVLPVGVGGGRRRRCAGQVVGADGSKVPPEGRGRSAKDKAQQRQLSSRPSPQQTMDATSPWTSGEG